MKRFVLFIICTLVVFAALSAQELKAKLTINTNKLPSPNTQLFSSLEQSLNGLLNERKWTDVPFNQNERINCNITISINEALSENSFSADIQVSSQRPVYNSSYITSLFSYRDQQFEFNYTDGQSLEVNNFSFDNNLVAVISFYAYIIIGLDFDSFSPNGGSPYFTKAMEIANMAQPLNTKGWEPFSGKNDNRYDLAIALTDDGSKNFHSMWYNYHRLGLDEMAANASRGRIRIMETVNEDLVKLYEARPSSLLLTVIAQTKLDEIVRVASQATAEEKQTIKKTLTRMFPTRSNVINGIK